MDNKIDISIIEAVILASPEPISAKRIADVIDDLTANRIKHAVEELNNRYMETGSSFRIRSISDGFQFYIIPEFTGYVEELFTRRRKMRLTRAALEAMAIIAYRQPVTKTEIEHIRGVASDGVLHNLLEKKLITITGRAESVGRPLQYGTTDEFLKFFGLNKLDDLPKMAEIEELVKATESINQTEFNLADGLNEEVSQKLNIADGTYDPSQSSSSDAKKSDIENDELTEPDSSNDVKEPEVEHTENSNDIDDKIISEEEKDVMDKESSVIVDVDAT